MIIITKRSPVALFGGHYVYHCEETEMLTIPSSNKIDKPSEEQRLMGIFKQVDMTKNFYFRCVLLLPPLCAQVRVPLGLREIDSIHASLATLMTLRPRCKVMLHHATNPIRDLGRSPTASLGTSICLQPRSRPQSVMLPKRVGSFLSFMAMSTKLVRHLSCSYSSDHHNHLISELTVLGRVIYVTLIARRSRHYAGARYLKRGVNEEVKFFFL